MSEAKYSPPICSVDHVRHEVIEGRLLHALADEAKVAILATREDLDCLIMGLEHAPVRRHGMLAGLRQLRDEAFTPSAQVDDQKGARSAE